MVQKPARIAQKALMTVAMLTAVALMTFAFAPPSREGVWGTGSMYGRWCFELSGLKLIDACAFATGQISLLIIWAALGSAPCFFRWSCMGAALWLVARPLHDGEWSWQDWQGYLWLDVLPHAMIAFTALCLLRPNGVRISSAAGLEDGPARRFTHIRLFRVVVTTAALAGAWMTILTMLYAFSVPANAWRGGALIQQLSRGVVLTAIDLLAVRGVLRPAALGWRQLLLVVPVVVGQAAIWNQVDAFVSFGIPLSLSLSRICVYDSLFLAPLIAVLLLARAAGYRLRSKEGILVQAPRLHPGGPDGRTKS